MATLPLPSSDPKVRDPEERVRELEAELAASKARNHQLFHTNLAVKLIIDPSDGRIVDANRAAAEFYGHSVESLRAMRISDINVLSEEEIRVELERARVQERTFFHFRHRCASREIRDVQVFSGPITLDGTDYLYSLIFDESARRTAEQALESERRRLRGFLDGSDVGTWEWNIATGDALYDARWAAIVGYQPSELEPMTVDTRQRLAHRGDLRLSRHELERHFRGDVSIYDVERRMLHRRGHWVWVRERGRVMEWDEDGRPLFMYGTISDISYAKDAEARLRRNVELLDQAEQVAGFGGWQLDWPTDRLEWTHGVYRIFGLPSEAPSVTWDDFLQLVHTEDRARVDETFRSSLDSGADGYEIIHRIRRASDGAVRHVVERCRHQRDPDGIVLRSAGTVQDITDRLEQEARQAEMERRLHRAERLESLGVLAGGIAHDFNNILTAIRGNAELALLEAGAAGGPDSPLADIVAGVERARELTERMLDFAGRGAVRADACHLDRIVREAARSVRAGLPTELGIDVADGTGRATAVADPTQLRHVVVALLQNAVEAMPPGPGRIHLRTGTRTCDAECIAGRLHFADDRGNPPSPGEWAYLEVEDSGTGIADEDRDRIFEPFFTTKFVGRGLGLAAVSGIVQRHGGMIDVRSAPGMGTRVRILLPRAETSEESAPTREDPCE